MSISLLFFSFSFLSYSATVPDALIEKKKKKKSKQQQQRQQRRQQQRKENDYRNRAFWMFTSWLILRFSFASSEKAFIIITKIWNLIWRCIKSVKILVIAFTTIVFAISKSSFAFAKRIYMMLTSSNKHLQAIKRVKQAKKYL